MPGRRVRPRKSAASYRKVRGRRARTSASHGPPGRRPDGSIESDRGCRPCEAQHPAVPRNRRSLPKQRRPVAEGCQQQFSRQAEYGRSSHCVASKNSVNDSKHQRRGRRRSRASCLPPTMPIAALASVGVSQNMSVSIPGGGAWHCARRRGFGDVGPARIAAADLACLCVFHRDLTPHPLLVFGNFPTANGPHGSPFGRRQPPDWSHVLSMKMNAVYFGVIIGLGTLVSNSAGTTRAG